MDPLLSAYLPGPKKLKRLGVDLYMYISICTAWLVLNMCWLVDVVFVPPGKYCVQYILYVLGGESCVWAACMCVGSWVLFLYYVAGGF